TPPPAGGSGSAPARRGRLTPTPPPSAGRGLPGTWPRALPPPGPPLAARVAAATARGPGAPWTGAAPTARSAGHRDAKAARRGRAWAGGSGGGGAAGSAPGGARGGAGGLGGVRGAADGAGGRDPRRVGRGRDHLPRVARGLLHGVRHRGAERHPADQSLAAPRAGRGHEVRDGAGDPRCPRTAVADPDDVAGDGPRAGAARVAGRAAGARDRAPAGGGRARRARHLHPAQPARAPLPVPAVRPEPPGAGRRRAPPRPGSARREPVMFSVPPARALAVIGVLSALPLAACGSSGIGQHAASPQPSTAAAPAQASPAAAQGGRNRFSAPTRVGNPTSPLVPGAEFSYAGSTSEGGHSTPHTVVFTVSGLTKVIHGVHTVVAWDRDFLKGKLQEQELAFFAQDDQGNVWNFGEYPEEYEH